MTRRKTKCDFQELRRLLRLALSVSLASSPMYIPAQIALCSDVNASIGLPAFPMPVAAPPFNEPSNSEISPECSQPEYSITYEHTAPQLLDAGASVPERRVARTALVQRLLGLERAHLSISSSIQLAALPSHDNCESNPCVSLGMDICQSAVASGNPIPGSCVVLASAAKGASPQRVGSHESESVVESLSDLDTANTDETLSLDVDPLDLLNSLDEVEPPTAVPTSEDSFNVSFNDRESTSAIVDPVARQPQLVKTNQTLSLNTGEVESNRLLNVENSKATIISNGSISTSGSNEATDTSSRRLRTSEPMRIQVVGQLDESPDRAHRKPLVAMLANHPAGRSAKSTDRNELPIHGDARDESFYSGENTQVSLKVEKDSPSLKQLMEIERSSQAQLQPVPGHELVEPEAVVVNSDHQIVVGLKDAVKLTSGNKIVGVSVEREDVCQLIATGPRSYSVIGLNEGSTRIALITEVSGERQIEIQQVTVGKQSSVGSDLNAVAENLTQTIKQLYPYSKVAIEIQGQQLVVKGMVDSEDSARKILTLVRRTTLMPVVDQLKSY